MRLFVAGLLLYLALAAWLDILAEEHKKEV
jgi:hypothetical protein